MTILDQLIAESDHITNEVYPEIDDRFNKFMKEDNKEGMKQSLRDIQSANNRMAELNRMMKKAVTA